MDLDGRRSKEKLGGVEGGVVVDVGLPRQGQQSLSGSGCTVQDQTVVPGGHLT